MSSSKKTILEQRLDESLKNFMIDDYVRRKILRNVKGQENVQSQIVELLESRKKNPPNTEEEKEVLLRDIAFVMMDSVVIE